jgi:hypothetical protein
MFIPVAMAGELTTGRVKGMVDKERELQLQHLAQHLQQLAEVEVDTAQAGGLVGLDTEEEGGLLLT